MRHEKANRVLDLARMLASSAEGMTLDEMAAHMGVARRTAERIRDAVEDMFPQLESINEPPQKRFRIRGGMDRFFQAPTADELAALESAAAAAAVTSPQRAELLRSLRRKVLSASKSVARLEPDIEVLVQAERIAVHAGARPEEDADVLAAVHAALKAGRGIEFAYGGGSRPGQRRRMAPYGLLLGRLTYLVGPDLELEGGPVKNWRLDRMTAVELLDRSVSAPSDFSLQAYADESFGIYHDEVVDIRLRITPEGAAEARRWRFHADQRLSDLPDGSVEVAFRACGLRELAWHLFTWGDQVRVLAPPALAEEMRRQLQTALAVHSGAVHSEAGAGG